MFSTPASMKPWALKPVANRFWSHSVSFWASLMGKSGMMKSWNRYTTAISAEMVVGFPSLVTSGHGYVLAGLMSRKLSPWIARKSGNPSSVGHGMSSAQ